MDDKTKQALEANEQALKDAQQVLANILEERKALLQPTTEEKHDAVDMVRDCVRDDCNQFGMSDPDFLWSVLNQVEFAREEQEEFERNEEDQ